MLNHFMELSIIIVNYNVEFYLEQCLNSVFKALKNIDAEVIVVDNNSVDGSIEMLHQNFPQVKLIQNKDNVGFSIANNQGIHISKGKYVLLLNPDTVVEENTFRLTVDFMNKTPKSGGLGVKMIDGTGKFLPESKRGLPTPRVAFYKIFGLSSIFSKSKKFGAYHLSYLDENEIHKVDVLSGAFMLMRKETLDKVGLLDETFFMYGEDIDLSYRIQLGGYDNYYYPETKIIHYKGESTKKGSLNYVFVFYNAMIIFAKKHFSKDSAKLFSILINLAIYLRASLSVFKRIVLKSILPFIDFLSIFSILVLGDKLHFKFFDIKINLEVFYPALIVFSLLWIIVGFFMGNYDARVKTLKVFSNNSFVALLLLCFYALVPEEFRFSRFIVLFSSFVSIFYMVFSRFLIDALKNKSLKPYSSLKRIAIVGSEIEIDRVKNLIKGVSVAENEFIDVIYSTSRKVNSSLIKEYISVHNLNEIVFCAKDISAQNIINMMGVLEQNRVSFKIAQPKGFLIIGSNSINDNGEFYTSEINNISNASNKRNKRFFDLFFSLILILFSPLLVLFQKKHMLFYKNIFNVFFGLKTFVGFAEVYLKTNEELPKLKKGILTLKSLKINANLDDVSLQELNILYAKNYSTWFDFKILLFNLNQLS